MKEYETKLRYPIVLFVSAAVATILTKPFGMEWYICTVLISIGFVFVVVLDIIIFPVKKFRRWSGKLDVGDPCFKKEVK